MTKLARLHKFVRKMKINTAEVIDLFYDYSKFYSVYVIYVILTYRTERLALKTNNIN